MAHTVFLEDRSKLTVTGVTEMGYYDDNSITAYAESGELGIRGENLKITKMDTDTGDLIVIGEIYAVVYSNVSKGKGGIFSGLFK